MRIGKAVVVSRPIAPVWLGVMLTDTAGLTDACMLRPRNRDAASQDRPRNNINDQNQSQQHQPPAQACRCQSSYGARAYLKIISGSEAVGWLQPGLQNRFPKAVNSSGAVSPATRANASSTAVRMPR